MPLNLDMNHLIMVTEASLENAEGMRRQFGYHILLVDEDGHYNLIHYGSIEIKLVAKEVMATEKQELVLGLQYSYEVHKIWKYLLRRNISLEELVDRK